jgi:hypothetical protein
VSAEIASYVGDVLREYERAELDAENQLIELLGRNPDMQDEIVRAILSYADQPGLPWQSGFSAIAWADVKVAIPLLGAALKREPRPAVRDAIVTTLARLAASAYRQEILSYARTAITQRRPGALGIAAAATNIARDDALDLILKWLLVDPKLAIARSRTVLDPLLVAVDRARNGALEGLIWRLAKQPTWPQTSWRAFLASAAADSTSSLSTQGIETIKEWLKASNADRS